MTRDDIVELLRGELALMPKYPEPDTDSALRHYDEAMHDCLEALRDACQYIVSKHDEEVQP